MIELVTMALLVACFALAAWIPWPMLLQLGAMLAAGGLLLGVPAGVLYHVRLRSALLRHRVLPERWWISPLSHHDLLPEPELRNVLPACYVGAAGFAVTAAGCALGVLAVLALLIRGQA